MSERATVLADRFAAANAQLMQLLTDATDAQLTHIVPEEGWSVLMVAHHVALSYRVAGSWVRHAAAGEAVPTTRAQIDAGNAHMAEDATPLTRASVLAELRDNGARAEDMIRGFSDDQLATAAVMMPAEGREMTAEQVIKHILLHHIKEHTPHLRPHVVRDAAH
ncbi:MAG: DinB family protein [Ktedonobacterales bacterium]|nr:DinB family protein [Ktedonobacterales bacterium]